MPMVRSDVGDRIAWVTIDRPAKMNAMTREFFAELAGAVSRAGSDEAVRAVVIHGAGPCFSAGADLDAFAELRTVTDWRRYVRDAQRAARTIEECPKPVIAAVHGHALGGGCELTLSCDLVVADETARFAMPETAIGLFPALAAVRGREHMSLHALKYMIMTGAILDARQAMATGLVNDVVAEGQHLASAEEWANLVATRSPLALATAKQLLGSAGWARHPHAVDAVAMLQEGGDPAAAFRA